MGYSIVVSIQGVLDFALLGNEGESTAFGRNMQLLFKKRVERRPVSAFMKSSVLVECE